jgi:hypothetical protein
MVSDRIMLLNDEPMPVDALCGDCGAKDPSVRKSLTSNTTYSLIKNSNDRMEIKATSNLLKWLLFTAIRKFIPSQFDRIDDGNLLEIQPTIDLHVFIMEAIALMQTSNRDRNSDLKFFKN